MGFQALGLKELRGFRVLRFTRPPPSRVWNCPNPLPLRETCGGTMVASSQNLS